MNEDYDTIVLGTGLKECILSGLMSSVAGKKVLVLDKNSYYGGESASLNLDQLYAQKTDGDKPLEKLGLSQKYCIDLCPKFLMACGNLVKILLQTKVTDYLEFRSVMGSYVFKKDKIFKVPSTAKDAMSSGLLGLVEKKRYMSFLSFVSEYDATKKDAHKKVKVPDMTAEDLYKHFSLGDEIKLFTGHAIALHADDSYLSEPASDLIDRVQLYANSVTRYGNSPYIYPKWGLGGLPEGFSRKCAVYNGVFMLNVDEEKDFIEEIIFDKDGKATGVKVGGETATCKQLIAAPDYFGGTDKIKKTGQVARMICILDQPIPNTKTSKKQDADSCQIIIPGAQVGRNSDIYVCMSSFQHNVADDGKYIAVMSTTVESEDKPEEELKPALALLGKGILAKFFWVSDTYAPANDPSKDNCFITSSMDATTHFESTTQEVLALYEMMTGKALDLTKDDSEEKKEEKKDSD